MDTAPLRSYLVIPPATKEKGVQRLLKHIRTRSPKEVFFKSLEGLIFTCAWHDADAVLLAERLEVKSPAVTGRKGNANKAMAGSKMGRLELACCKRGSMRQNPCT